LQKLFAYLAVFNRFLRLYAIFWITRIASSQNSESPIFRFWTYTWRETFRLKEL